MKVRNPVFLVSPRAGPGRGERRLAAVLKRIGEHLAGCRIVAVRALDEVGEVVLRLDPEQVPVAVGGDGTVSLIASALWISGRADVPLSILPLGTANALATALGIDSPRRGLHALEDGKEVHIDVIHTSHPMAPVAVVSLSAGFEARFLSVYSRTRRWSRPIAALAGSPQLVRKRDTLSLTLDGEHVVEPGWPPFGAGLYNTPGYAPGVTMSPHANLRDGLAESIVFRDAQAYLGTLGDAIRGRFLRDRPGVIRSCWREARLESLGPLQIDGENLPPGTVLARVVPGGLRVLVPTT